jgi:UDP-N-acetylglucosamine 4,6-dehydratase
MQGGEIFIPKIPSMYITELAKAMAPNLKHEIIGIRPGEKLHEVMYSVDDSHLTLEFSDHFVVCPSIQLNNISNFNKNLIGEVGVKVGQGYEYNSGKNTDWLSREEFLKMVDEIDFT